MKQDISPDAVDKALQAFERMKMKAAFTRFLQETNQRSSDGTAKDFASQTTHGNSVRFRERNEEEIYNLLIGKF